MHINSNHYADWNRRIKSQNNQNKTKNLAQTRAILHHDNMFITIIGMNPVTYVINTKLHTCFDIAQQIALKDLPRTSISLYPSSQRNHAICRAIFMYIVFGSRSLLHFPLLTDVT